MAVPSSGPLELRGDINLEVNGNVTDTNVALHQLAIDAGFSTPDAMSDFYGYTSVVVPTVQTNAVTNTTSQTSQTLNGNVSDTGGENVSRGFYHGTDSSAATNNTKRTIAGTQGTGAFSCNRSGLTFGTLYYNWAFACNSAGESIGSMVSARTAYPAYDPDTCGCSVCCLTLPGSYSCNINASPDDICYNCGQVSFNAQQGYINPYTGGSCPGANVNQCYGAPQGCCVGGFNSQFNIEPPTPSWCPQYGWQGQAKSYRGICNYFCMNVTTRFCRAPNYCSGCHDMINCSYMCFGSIQSASPQTQSSYAEWEPAWQINNQYCYCCFSANQNTFFMCVHHRGQYDGYNHPQSVVRNRNRYCHQS